MTTAAKQSDRTASKSKPVRYEVETGRKYDKLIALVGGDDPRVVAFINRRTGVMHHPKSPTAAGHMLDAEKVDLYRPLYEANRPTPALPSRDWDRVNDGLIDLDPVLDTVIVWLDGKWWPAQIDHAATRAVTVAVYDWVTGPDGEQVHVDDTVIGERPLPVEDLVCVPVEDVARLHRDRDRPGRPAIGRKIGPYPVRPGMRDAIVDYEHTHGYAKQAGAVRDLLQIGLRGPYPLPDELRKRVEAYQHSEDMDSYEQAIELLLDDALAAADY